MFNGAKQTFGATPAAGGFGFGNNTAAVSPFGAPSAFGKPATPGFGQPQGFGQPAQSAFGAAQPQNNLFGAPANQTPSFGAPAANTATGFGGFGQPQQPQQQQTSLFGAAPQPAQSTSLFGQPSTSAFGAAKPPAFGFGAAQPTPSLFNQASTSTASTGFGGFAPPATSGATGMFGAAQPIQSAFGQPGQNGSAVAKYQEVIGTDTLIKNGQTNNVSTKHHCITAMKEYEAKSLEEIRTEDYMANRKGPQAGAAVPQQQAGGMFGATAAPANTSLFGNNQMGAQNTSIFGQPAQNTMNTFAQPTNTLGSFGTPQTSAFGQPAAQQQQPQQAGGMFGNAFPAPATSTNSSFGFTGAAANTSLFGAKPFGQTTTPAATGTGLFGQPAVSAAPAFGQPQPAATGFGTFGQTSVQQTAPLFGGGITTTAGAFGQPASQAQTGFGGFGNTATSMAGGGGMFGAKPATGAFGAAGTFGAPAPAANTTFGFAQPAQQNSLFNNTFNKPATAPNFGSFGTQSAAPTMGTGLLGGNNNTSLFGNTAAKPGGLFGNAPAATGGGMFGSSFGGNTTLGGGLGQNTMGMGQGFGQMGQPPQTSSIPIHQQIMSLATSPYGDNPIFKDLQPLGLSEEALKPTNPAAQKTMLESSSNQFKVSPRVSLGLKVKPVGSSFTKKSLFGGLEEFDSSVDESFSLKPNAKRLIIKPKSTPTGATGSTNQSPAHLPAARFAPSAGLATPESTRRLNISRNATPTPRAVNNESGSDANLTTEEVDSFRNQIPTSAPPRFDDNDNARRVSWLHSNALEKVTKHKRHSDMAMDNTIHELVGTKEDAAARNEARGGVVYLERRSNAPDELRSKATMAAHTSSDSMNLTSRSFLDETNADLSLINTDAHPAGVVLQRSGYYTIPSLESLIDFIGEDGSCIVPNFTVGRRGYGSVYFDAEIDVAGLNLDELVHFRHKEVIIYPDDENKPPVGTELNRKAEITLDQVWPHDKTLRQPIKDRERLEAMDYTGKLRRVCEKHEMRFVDYRPETGSWVFRVEHFSKYGLNDSDDEDDVAPADPKKAKMAGGLVVAGEDGAKVQTNLGAIPKTTLMTRPQDKENVAQVQPHGLGGFDARFDAQPEDFSMDFTHRPNYASSAFEALSPSAANAMETGTDSHKLQLMKASFFVDDDFDGKSVASELLDGRDSPDQTVPHPAYLRQRGGQSFSIASGSSMGHSKALSTTTINSSKLDALIEAAPQQHRFLQPATMVKPDTATAIAKPLGPKSVSLHIKPKVARIKIPNTVVPLNKSIAATIEPRSAADLAFAFGRRFKIGWAAQNALLTLNTFAGCQQLPIRHCVPIDRIDGDLYKGRSVDDRTMTLLVQSKIASIEPIPTFHASIEAHLQLQLKHCRRDTSASKTCPRISGGGGTTILDEHLEVARVITRLGDCDEYGVSVWSLCNALWGEQEELEGQHENSHLTTMRRRELLSEWLEVVVTEKATPKTGDSYLEHLLSLLYSHKVIDACDLCFNNEDLNLAFLLAQLSGGPAVRQLMQHQMSAWQEVEADAFIDVNRLKAYMLVSGVSLISSAHGAINIFEEVDWLKALALNVWYLSSATASITDSLLAYEQSFQSEEFHALPPTPPYSDSYQPQRGSDKPIEDVRFHLLKLYSKRSHPLEALLNPATHTADTMDFRLSWLLLQSLESIGYRHCSKLAANQLHVSFASQLENHGMWHWAIFVLMHIEDQKQRELSVQSMLYKYVRLSADDGVSEEAVNDQVGTYTEQESFLIEELGVSCRWIYWAKAVRAGAMQKPHAQAEFLLKAEQWAMAHEVIMLHIAPDAVINDNIVYVKNLLQRFQDTRQIPNWLNQGSILLEYIDLSEKFEQLKHLPDTRLETAWQQLKPQLSDLCSRINLFPCPTAKHRLCQSEIAQRLANLVSGVQLLCPEIDSCTLLRIILEKLPLPQEYAKQKMRALLEDSRLVDEMQRRDLA